MYMSCSDKVNEEEVQGRTIDDVCVLTQVVLFFPPVACPSERKEKIILILI